LAALTDLDAELRRRGFLLRGGFRPRADDAVPPLPDGRRAGTLLLVGSVGPGLWASVQASPEAGGPDPVDRYTARAIGEFAAALSVVALFPFDGPPWHPFQRWAMRAEPGLRPSPLGILIHPVYGLWHAYRAALLLAEALPLPEPAPLAHPCERCVDRPCLSACPAGALASGAYDVPRCRSDLRARPDAPCHGVGCLARRACPVGREWTQEPAQAAHHTAAFAGSPRQR
jgi:hypothetical protein